ncbi:acyl-CoA dehydrogenase family protein [Aureimonas frigidaquae]|uniref:Acyl-CoA dehydrogenase n=1 Tax=Aureimonas frigidaquae TaxID=424757 RepID=A0A0P0Z3R7_9HYPH|nr:acyl-CoA dehydrogenase family protein [Aureimonas frigidaquae]BAT28741.1 hypothetical protein [Aureimonas frigidaquae]
MKPLASADLPPSDATMLHALDLVIRGSTPEELDPALSVLVEFGLLDRFILPDAFGGGFRYVAAWVDVLKLLSGLGGVDLSVARILEGHLNALQLVATYGQPDQQAMVLRHAGRGDLLGVWGADATEPVRMHADGPGSWRLTGAKRYATAVGTVQRAVVPVTDDNGQIQLLLLPVADDRRVDLASWNHRGMRRSASGTFRFDGMRIGPSAILGALDDYRREPLFVGGIWRCAAAQLGAIEAVVAGICRELSDTGRDAHPLQMARIGSAILAARTARLWVEDAAARVEACSPDAPRAHIEHVVALAAYARLATEKAAMEVIDLAERGLGLASFAAGHAVEALTRDLAVYIRQANPDAVLLQHGRVLARRLSDGVTDDSV